MNRAQLRPVALEPPPLIEGVADDSKTGAVTTPDASPPDQAEAIESPDESRDEVNPRSWRGVYAVEYPDEVLFTKRIDIRPDQLDEWRPEPAASRRHTDHDD
jgi:hypothetical protein